MQKRTNINKKLSFLFVSFVIVTILSAFYIIPPTFSRYISKKSLSATLSISKPIFTIVLDEQNPTTHGTTSIYEKYSIGFYLNQTATNYKTSIFNHFIHLTAYKYPLNSLKPYIDIFT